MATLGQPKATPKAFQYDAFWFTPVNKLSLTSGWLISFLKRREIAPQAKIIFF